MIRGQCRAYRDEKDVAPDSTVETYAAVRLSIDSPRWKGVPFLIRAGKYLATTVCEVLVTFKQPVMFADGGASNFVRFRLSPDVLITIGAQVKRAGEAMVTEPAEFTVVHHPDGDEMDAYERLLGDALDGDAMLFAREDCVEAAWEIVEPVLGDVTPVHSYESPRGARSRRRRSPATSAAGAIRGVSGPLPTCSRSTAARRASSARSSAGSGSGA